MFFSGIEIGERPKSHENIMGTSQQPWLPVEAIEFLENNLNKNHTGFEFGSGSSSFWFAKLTKKLYSVESDSIWNKMMLDLAEANNVNNIFLNCIECDMLAIWDKDLEIGGNYDLYAKEIQAIDINFDYILIDGVARSSCILNSIKKLNPGGYLIIDNAERPAYFNSIEKIPKNWQLFEFKNLIDTTLIFKKEI